MFGGDLSEKFLFWGSYLEGEGAYLEGEGAYLEGEGACLEGEGANLAGNLLRCGLIQKGNSIRRRGCLGEEGIIHHSSFHI